MADSEESSIPINCTMGSKEEGEFNIVAAIRLSTACLSILGSLSIIGSACYRKTVCNPKVHPIFVLSVVDSLLAVLWISGAWVWLRGGDRHHHHLRVSCFTLNLLTVILQCVAMNVTLIYALMAYSSIRQRDFSGVYVVGQNLTVRVWPPLASFTLYLVAWMMPFLLVLIPFAVLSLKYKLVQDANSCSCWCLPFYGNVLPRPPLAYDKTIAGKEFLHHLHYFTASYSVILITTFLVVLCGMSIVYCKIFYRIRKMVRVQERCEERPLLGANRAMILAGQKDAKNRVFFFFLIYIISGATTFVFGVLSVVVVLKYKQLGHRPYQSLLYILLIMEGLLVPSQGFMNALAYGWTRGDFLSVMSSRALTGYPNSHNNSSSNSYTHQ